MQTRIRTLLFSLTEFLKVARRYVKYLTDAAGRCLGLLSVPEREGQAQAAQCGYSHVLHSGKK
jgi:hypothetical protein